MARQVWKPFEWAEMPRMACMLTGRPMKRSWTRPAQSVQRLPDLDLLLERRMRQLGGDARMVAAGTPVCSATASGAYRASR